MTRGEQKRKGRPPKTEDERKSINLTFRARKNLRERLQKAAHENGRSLSEETEYRVESTFSQQDFLILALGGPDAGNVIRAILFLFAGLQPRKIDWRNNPAITEAMRRAISLIGEAAFSEDRLSEERQQEFLKSFYEARNGDLVPINGEATDVAILALIAMQSSGLAETMVPLLKGRKIKANTPLPLGAAAQKQKEQK